MSIQSLQVHLSSSKGPIDVFLCTDGGDSGSLQQDGLDVNGNHPAFLKVSQGKRFYSNNTLVLPKKDHPSSVFFFLFLISEAAADGMADGVKMNGSSNGGVNAYGPLTGSAPMSPLSSSLSSILQQPEESIPFVPLSPALLSDEYMLGLGDEQGISDLFDSCDLDTLALDDLLRIWAIPETDRTSFQVDGCFLVPEWNLDWWAQLWGWTTDLNFVAFDIDRLRIDLTAMGSRVSVVW